MAYGTRTLVLIIGIVAATAISGCSINIGNAPAKAPLSSSTRQTPPITPPTPPPPQQSPQPTPSPWTTPCPSGTSVSTSEASIGLCVDSSGFPQACEQPELQACAVDLQVAQCLTTHNQAESAWGDGSNPVYTACKGDPSIGVGVLGVTVTDTPTDWSVAGCELVNVTPQSPAAQAGLTGSDNRTDPVGDVVYGVTVGSTTITVGSCSDFLNALQSTVPGMQITLEYDHRDVVLLVGSWVAKTTPPITLGS